MNVSAIGPPVSMIQKQFWQCELRTGEIVPVRIEVRVPLPAVAHEHVVPHVVERLAV